MILEWRIKGEVKLADWFEGQYLSPEWSTWWIGVVGVVGVLPNQNPIESDNA